MLAGFCPVEGYSEDIAKFIVIGALGTVFPCLNLIKHFRKKKKALICRRRILLQPIRKFLTGIWIWIRIQYF